ncbi:MAG: hypothetical protein QM771_16220 [Nitrospira sp.]
MLFSEANEEWQAVPPWVLFLIRLGFQWPSDGLKHRRIALVSMPCDSAAAGLIALGALIRDLGNPNANDVDGHYDALLRYAHQYLERCRDCNMRCRPELKGCGYAGETTGLVRNRERKLYKIVKISQRKDREAAIVCLRQSITRWIFRHSATDWHIDGEPPSQLCSNDQKALPIETYNRIIAEAQIIRDNLRRSFSGLCIAGRVAGKPASREAYASIRFLSERCEYGLSDLLTVHEWLPSNMVSRLTYFNALTGTLDRRSSAPNFVVADGSQCFLKVLTDFQRSDVIGVIQRTMTRKQLEDVGNRIVGLRQWYVEDTELLGELRDVPRGISVLILSKRIS